jgi:CRISPR/Cas system-associated exonuclease Cas4 (RecB family)
VTAAAVQLRPDLTGARLSSLARCPRQAFYTATEPAPEYDEQTRRYFERGRLYEDLVIRQLEAKHPNSRVLRQHPVKWGLEWEGHLDALILPEGIAVEVVSTVSPSGLIFDFKLEQLRLYMAHTPEAKSGVLYVVNPSSLRGEDIIPVTLTDQDRQRIENAVTAVVEAVRAGEPPERVCAKPSEARAHLCPFAETCFFGWEPPPPSPLSKDAEQAAMRMLALKVRRDNLRRELRDADAEWRNEGDALLLEGVEPGQDYEAGGVKVKAVEVKGRETFSLSKFRKAGQMLPGDEDRLGPFIQHGEPYVRWTVSGEHVEAETDDFGDVPF